MRAACMNCVKVSKCTETDVAKLRNGYFCDNWEAASREVVWAREQVVKDLGDQGLVSILKTNNKP